MQKQYEYGIRDKNPIICAGIILLCFFCAVMLTLVLPVPFSIAENQKNDLLLRARYYLFGKQRISPYIIHVVLNDTTIRNFNLPLWDRTIYGRIIRLLSAAQVDAIACDIFFQFESQPQNDTPLVEATKKSKKVYYPVVLQPAGYNVLMDENDSEQLEKASLIWSPGFVRHGNPPQTGGVKIPFYALSNAAKGLGHINCTPDHDGINRRFPLLFAYNDGYVPSLVLRVIADYLDVTTDRVDVVFGSHIRLKDARFPGRRKKDVVIPIDEQGKLIINFVGTWADSFIPFPVDNILEAEKDEGINTHLYDIMEDSLVILSNVSTGNKDYGASAFDTIYPLSGIHLNVANMILTENFIHEDSLLEKLITGLVIALLLWGVSFGKRSKHFLFWGFLIFAVFIIFHAFLFFLLSRFGAFVPVAMGIVFSVIAVGAFHYTAEEKEKSFFRGKYEHEKENILYKNRLILYLANALSTPLKRISHNTKTLYEKDVAKHLLPFREALLEIDRSCTTLLHLVSELLDLTKYKSGKTMLPLELKVESEGETEEEQCNEVVENEISRVCILVVDDDENERRRIREVCKDLYSILEAENGKKAIELIQSKRPELIITDLIMPEMNGDELIAFLKKKEETANIPVILITGLPGEEIREEADDFLSKQFTDKELLKSIENTRERAIQKKQLESYRKQLVITSQQYNKISALEGQLYPNQPIIIVEDEKEILLSYKDALESKGVNNILLFSESSKVLSFLLEHQASLIILDTTIPDFSGEELILEIRNRFPDIPVIMASGITDIETALRCIGFGAYDYLIKPVEIEKLTSLINHCIELRLYKDELISMSSKLKNPGIINTSAFSHIITQNEKIHALFHYSEAVAPGPKPLLIMGESGVGKELFAEAIHKASGRTGRFVCENIGGLDDTMISDTLFGHIKGAFTGAEKERKGLLEEAACGTLFLDEIGDMPIKTQVKLLRLIEKNEYRQLGSDTIKRTDARIICATNRNIEKMVEKETFRHDLFRRFIHNITIPPLRQRWDDLPLLVEHFIKKYSGKRKPSVPDELYGYLKIYNFPGNVRELETMVVNALRLNKGNTLSLTTFKEYINEKRSGKGIPKEEEIIEQERHITVKGKFPTLKEVEERFIEMAIEKADGMQTIASQLLGITPSNLSKKLKKIRKKEK
jgi:DNA-binding NtrC family response regulator/CHASE2 domain-containing sensor protein